MFNVRLSYALVQATRRYMLYSTWPPGSEVQCLPHSRKLTAP